MLIDDKKTFLQWLTFLAESFNRKVSTLLVETYWESLKGYSFVHVKHAILTSLQNPEYQKWGMPTPADLIYLIQGDVRQESWKAWSQVVTAIRTIGHYDSVVFDNPIIHAVIRDMGGWIFLGQHTEKEFSFLRYNFEKNYRRYHGQSFDYPRSLKGRLAHEHEVQGFSYKTADPILIEDPQRALAVYNNGNPQRTKQLSLSEAQKQMTQQIIEKIEKEGV